MPFFVQLAAALLLQVVGYLLMPKPKSNVEAQEFEAPTASANKPMPIIFGTKRVKAVNCIWAGEKSTDKRKV